MVKRTIELQTSRLILRRITIDDAKEMFHNWASDHEVAKYLTWAPHKDINETKEIINYWLNKYDEDYFFQWVIEHKESNHIIGTISLFGYENNTIELGYVIARSYWNQGITTEAAKRVIEFAFSDTSINKIVSRHSYKNPASGKVMEKNKMVQYSEKIELIPNIGELHTMLLYSLKKEDYK